MSDAFNLTIAMLLTVHALTAFMWAHFFGFCPFSLNDKYIVHEYSIIAVSDSWLVFMESSNITDEWWLMWFSTALQGEFAPKPALAPALKQFW